MSGDDIGSLAWVSRMEAQAAAARVATDDESKPMTRTELAMLWDLLGRFCASHSDQVEGGRYHARTIRERIDAELAERFGS